ncbi:MAG: hypothetical protein KY458_11715 [Actinobacteria bacterium]|nr:hypothetical protein [Actinomycetota bacterium]
MTAIRKVLLVGMTIGALAVGGMSVAWACTASSNIKADPGSGLAGSQVQLTGSGFLAPSSEAGGEQVGAVEIRWNSTSGPMLATATDAEFSTQVTVPRNAAARRYFFVAVQRRADGSIVRNAAAPFLVTAPAGEPAPPAPANPEPPADEERAAASASNEAAPAQPEPVSATAAPANAANAANAEARPAARPAGNGAAVARSTRSGDAAVAAPPTDPGEPAEAAAAPPSPPPTPEVSPRSVTGDIGGAWTSGATGTRGPSLTDASLPATRTAGSGLGVGLLTLGTATLLAGAFVGLRSRRRATSDSI